MLNMLLKMQLALSWFAFQIASHAGFYPAKLIGRNVGMWIAKNVKV